MTRPAVSQVLAWRPDSLGEAAGRVRTVVRATESEAAGLESTVRATEGRWVGSAGLAAREQISVESAQAQGLVEALQLTAAALETGERELSAARQRVTLLLDEALGQGLQVDDDGGVHAPAGHGAPLEGSAADGRYQHLVESAQRLGVLLREALLEAESADRSAGIRLSRIALPEPLEREAAGLEGAGIGTRTAPVPALLPWALGAMSPSQAAAWWRSLPFDQQQLLIHSRGAVIGNLDGVPAWARDQANREQLPRLRARLERELASASAYDAPPYGGPGTAFGVPPNPVPIDELAGKLRALDRIEEVLAQGGRQLLLLDADSGKELHAAVAIGDVDSAVNVAVFTPGFTSNVQNSLRGYDRDMQALKDRAEKDTGGSATTATVAWLGYDAPQLGGLLSITGSVASSHPARAGGHRLASFFRGIRASRQDDPHLTALGHSYGSSTTGYALQHSGLGVDDAVFFGSPGTSARHRSDLQVGAGHLYDLAARNDPVASVQRFGTLPQLMRGFEVLSTDAVPGRHLREVTGHTNYLTPGSTSQWNLAAVVVGDPVLMIPAPEGQQPEWLGRFG